MRLGPGTDRPDIFTFISLPLPGFADIQLVKGGGSDQDVCGTEVAERKVPAPCWSSNLLRVRTQARPGPPIMPWAKCL